MFFKIASFIGIIISFAASVLLFNLSRKTKVLKRGLKLLSLGVFLGLGVHAIFEMLESFNVIAVHSLLKIMPVFVVIGSSLIMLGGLDILKKILSPMMTMIKNLERAKLNEASAKDNKEVIAEDNELTLLSSLIVEEAKKIAEQRQSLNARTTLVDQIAEKKEEELKEKAEEFNKIYALILEREQRIEELKERIKELEQNK